jgi:RNA polymerase sigma-70 factor (ECF subfamily)
MDEHLIARAKAGDSDALIVLYERHKQQVFRYLYYRLGDVPTAEDLTTETFLRVIQALPRFRNGGAPIQAWIFQIARNLATDRLRRTKRDRQELLDDEVIDPALPPEIMAEKSLVVAELHTALQQLTDDQREVILLRFIEGLSIADVAHTISKSESAVKNLQLRGLRSLQRLLSAHSLSHTLHND